MPVRLKTSQINLKEVAGVIAGVRVVGSRQFVEEEMKLQEMGDRVLAFLKRIFPKSPSGYPRREKRPPLVQGWTKFPHPAHLGTNPGFTVRRRYSDEREHEIIASLDQGSRPYNRIIPRGKKAYFIKGGPNILRPGAVGEPVFVTGNGLIFRYKGRRGLHFMDRTYDFARSLVLEAERKYKIAAKRKLKNA